MATRGRLSEEGYRIATQQKSGDGVKRRMRLQPDKIKTKPRIDFHKQNLERLKFQQEFVRMQKREIARRQKQRRRRVRRHDDSALKGDQDSDLPSESDASSLSSLESSGSGKRDFVRENIAALRMVPKKKVTRDEGTHEFMKRNSFGRVPAYLRKRRVQEQENSAAKERAKVPAGMRLLSEAERLEALQSLKKQLQDNEMEIRRLPLQIHTLKTIARQNQLLSKSSELENAVKLFSRKRVFVPSDDC